MWLSVISWAGSLAYETAWTSMSVIHCDVRCICICWIFMRLCSCLSCCVWLTAIVLSVSSACSDLWDLMLGMYRIRIIHISPESGRAKFKNWNLAGSKDGLREFDKVVFWVRNNTPDKPNDIDSAGICYKTAVQSKITVTLCHKCANTD